MKKGKENQLPHWGKLLQKWTWRFLLRGEFCTVKGSSNVKN